MSEEYRYSACGPCFRSQIHLPELQATCNSGEPDGSIRIGVVPELLEVSREHLKVVALGCG